MKRVLVVLLSSVSTLLACQKAPSPDAPTPGAPGGATAEAAQQFTFSDTQEGLLFTYVDARGNVLSVDKAEDVPLDRRQNVMVVDLSKSPEQRQADRYVFFADLTVKDPQGNHVANVVSRYHAAAAADGTPAQAFADDTQKGDILVYSAVWCGYCKKTKAFLKERGVPFRERDVEKDNGAEAELQSKARRAGVRVSGVPVTDFMGELVMGFDQGKLEQLIRKRAANAQAAPGP